MVVRLLIIIILFNLGMVGYVSYIENSKMFFPDRDIGFTPEMVSLEFEDVYIEAEDKVKINGWFIPAPDNRYTVLFCHGNGGNIAGRLDKIMLLRNIGASVFIIDYRGYGRSQGRPCERGVYADARAAYDYLVNGRGLKPEQIVLYGESLGGGVAVELASRLEVRALILEGAFSSIRDIGRKLYPFLSLFLTSNKFNSLAKIGKITVPKLFIHSRTDEIVPFSLGQKLYNAAVAPKQMVEIAGGHNSAVWDSKEKYISAIKEFVDNL
jgi:fermentation-respiration switch protein FrsA (DUF1100 family)